MNDALRALSGGDRDVILLRFFDGLSLQELGDRLGTTEDTARKRVARAVDRLRLALQRDDSRVASPALAVLLADRAAPSIPLAAKASLAAVAHCSASGKAPLAAGSRAALIQQGVVQSMQATTRTLIGAAAAAVVVGATGATALLRAQSIPPPGSAYAYFIDTATPPAGNPDYDAAHAEIAADYKDMVALFARRDPTWATKYSAKNLVFTGVRGKRAGLSDMVSQSRQNFESLKTFTATMALLSLDVHGATATATFSTRLDGLANGRIENNARIVSDEQETATWQKQNGRWVVVAITERVNKTTRAEVRLRAMVGPR